MPKIIPANIIRKEQFIAKAVKVHGNKYDYSNVDYQHSHKKIEIICPIHGSFYQTIGNHLRSKGCVKCTNENKTLSTTQFVKKSKLIHGNKYNYSKSSYVSSHDKICIICKKHGEWQQTPNSHLNGNGCPTCKSDSLSSYLKFSTAQFIKKCKLVHGNKYDYSKVVYKNMHTDVEIVCPKHGSFFQRPNNHLREQALCPRCTRRISKGEQKVIDFLTDKQIEFTFNKTFSDLRGKHKRALRYDFFLPNQQTVIEFDGRQHFQPIRLRGISQQRAIELHNQTAKNDKKKNKYAKDNGYKMLRIRYDEDIKDTITAFLGERT